jgi:hypothetical protein
LTSFFASRCCHVEHAAFQFFIGLLPTFHPTAS